MCNATTENDFQSTSDSIIFGKKKLKSNESHRVKLRVTSVKRKKIFVFLFDVINTARNHLTWNNIHGLNETSLPRSENERTK